MINNGSGLRRIITKLQQLDFFYYVNLVKGSTLSVIFIFIFDWHPYLQLYTNLNPVIEEAIPIIQGGNG